MVCPMYERLQVLQFSLYMPLLSCSVLCWCGVYCSNCCMVFVVLYVICRFVHLNRLVIVRMVGIKYVNHRVENITNIKFTAEEMKIPNYGPKYSIEKPTLSYLPTLVTETERAIRLLDVKL